MANNYDQFSEALLLGKDVLDQKKAWITEVLALTLDPEGYDTEDEAIAVFKKRLGELLGDEKLAEAVDYPESWPDFQHELDEGDDGELALHLYGEESFDLDHVITFVQAYLKKFDPKAVFRMTWAGTCSKMRVSEFTGGWCVVTADKYVSSSAHSDAEEVATEMAKEIGGHVMGLEMATRLDDPNVEAVARTLEAEFGDLVRDPDVAHGLMRYGSAGVGKTMVIQEVFAKKYAREGETLKDALERVVEVLNEEDPEQNTQRALASLVGCYTQEGETYGDTVQRMLKVGDFAARHDTITKNAYCECDGHPLSGVMVNMEYEHAVIERCDTCSLFRSDDHAAFFVARLLKKEVEFAIFREGMSPRPYIKDMTPEEVASALKRFT